MAAVAQRHDTEYRQPTTARKTNTSRQNQARRRPLLRFSPAVRYVFYAMVFVMAMGWMSVYAKIALAGYQRNQLTTLCRQERLKNQSLKLKMNSLSCPDNVEAAAKKSGMVYASRYVYLDRPQSVASANSEDGE